MNYNHTMKELFLKTKLFYLPLFILLFIITACEKSDNTSSDETDSNIKSGFWIINEEVNGDCSGSEYPEYKTGIYYIKPLTGGAIEITEFPGNIKYKGKLSGNKVTWENSYSSGSGQTIVSFNGILKENYSQIEGSAEWTWTSSSYSCKGHTSVNGVKASDQSASFGGTWNGEWQSEEYGMSGSFCASVIQEDSILTGTISIPEIGMENASLKGNVYGNIVFFGDVDDEIQFVGLVDSKDAQGLYAYESLGDEGKWEATWSAPIVTKKLDKLSSVNLPEEISQVYDMTYDGENLWILTYDQVIKIDEKAVIIETKETPGIYPDGVARAKKRLDN